MQEAEQPSTSLKTLVRPSSWSETFDDESARDAFSTSKRLSSRHGQKPFQIVRLLVV
jgi:hypothetical protein